MGKHRSSNSFVPSPRFCSNGLAQTGASASFSFLCKQCYCHRCCHFLSGSAIIFFVVFVVHILGSEIASTQGERHVAWHGPGNAGYIIGARWFERAERLCLSQGRLGHVRCLAVWANGWATAGSTCTFLTGSKRKNGTEKGETKAA